MPLGQVRGRPWESLDAVRARVRVQVSLQV
jgi:hypothetical protein